MSMSFVQAQGATASGVTFVDVVQTINPVVGNLLFAVVKMINDTTVTITDTIGNVWTPIGSMPLLNTGFGGIYAAWAINKTNAANTVRGTCGTTTNPGIVIAEFNTTESFNIPASNNLGTKVGTTSPITPTSAIANTVANALLIEFGADLDDTGNSRTKDSTFTVAENTSRVLVAYRIVTSTGSYTPIITLGYGGNHNAMAAVVFQEAAPAGSLRRHGGDLTGIGSPGPFMRDPLV